MVRSPRVSVSDAPDLRALHLGALAIGVPKQTLNDAYAEALKAAQDKVIGKHKDDALEARQKALNEQIFLLKQETEAIEKMKAKK